MQLYPHWNARDNYRYGAKKKKRKRDKSDDPGAVGSGSLRAVPGGSRGSTAIFPLLILYSLQWHDLGKAEQAKYYEMAKVERLAHITKGLTGHNCHCRDSVLRHFSCE